ncbi:HTH-type transcriptional regulator YofA [BD1-7 clade bacterium]|uniref:HTH-type transcriptional regulator YofA n=1 Tax=BD1-7 clade bacterium TaxID=2029982 RepID=A0A5S9QXD1_9GAMM|nr:HTH-type transcriptional regulator YofA [BD1-7 clade bacterium]
MNWDNIRIFTAVHECGSIGKAAARLSLNHSTVLRRLDQLEQTLGVKLFVRSTSGYRMTDAAEQLLEHATTMHDSANAFHRAAAGNTEETASPIRITLSPSMATTLMRSIVKFQAQYPQYQLDVAADINLSDLSRLEADVAIRYTNNPPEHYVGRQVLSLPQKLYVSHQYLAEHPSMRDVSDIEDWVVLEMPAFGNQFEQWIESLGDKGRVSIKTNATDLAIEAVAGGAGACFLPELRAAERAELTPLDLDPFDSMLGIWLLTHKDLRYQPNIRRFMRFMAEDLQKKLPLYATHSE